MSIEYLKLLATLAAIAKKLANLSEENPEAYAAFMAAVKETVSDATAARVDGKLTPQELLEILGDVSQAVGSGAKLALAALAK